MIDLHVEVVLVSIGIDWRWSGMMQSSYRLGEGVEKTPGMGVLT